MHVRAKVIYCLGILSKVDQGHPNQLVDRFVGLKQAGLGQDYRLFRCSV